MNKSEIKAIKEPKKGGWSGSRHNYLIGGYKRHLSVGKSLNESIYFNSHIIKSDPALILPGLLDSVVSM
jgi:hypothetical protein